MRPWLFVAYGGGHAAMLLPVARLAMERGHNVRFLALTTGRQAVEEAGIPVLGMRDLLDHAASRALDFGHELAAALPSGGPVARDESTAYLGISFAELVADLGEGGARRAYGERGRHAFLPTRFFCRVLAALDPAVVIATNSPRAEQAALLASGQLGIPSVCAVDLFAIQEVKWVGQPNYADRLCVLNEGVRSMMIAHGRGPEEVVVTGNPAFDRLTAPDVQAEGAAMRHARGWDDGGCTILWASQIEPLRHPFDGRPGDPQLPREVEAQLRAIVAKHPGFRLVVRYHPSENVVFTPAPNISFSPREESLQALLNAVDIVVVTASTVGLEAANAGRPVISVDRSVFTADTPYTRFGVSTGIDRMDDLESTLLTVASGLGGNSTPITVPAESGAAERIFSVVEAVASRRKLT